jgi:hypothetical protein
LNETVSLSPDASEAPASDGAGKKYGGLRFWAIAAFSLLWILNWVSVLPLLTNPNHPGTQDFSIFYTGSRIVMSGLSSHLYDLSVQAHYQTPPYQSQPLPFDHPAYELILFMPLALLSFTSAFWSWITLNIVLVALAAKLLSAHLPNFPPPTALWVFAAATASFPLIWSLCQGQDSILLLIVFVFVFINLKAKRDLIAGVVLAAGLFKFTLVIPFVFAFLFMRRWRFLAGFLAGSALTVGISVWITGIAGARQYIELLSLLSGHPAVGYINLFLMPNVRGFLLTMVTGHGMRRQDFEIFAGIMSVLLLIVPLLTSSSAKQLERLDFWFALNMTVAVLVSPHLYWHDLTILLLPLLLAANALAKSDLRANMSFAAVVAWAVLYATAWPVWPAYFAVFRIVSPSYFFLLLCVFVLWLASRLKTLSPGPAMEAVSEIV